MEQIIAVVAFYVNVALILSTILILVAFAHGRTTDGFKDKNNG